jgi:hypothetical protein
MTGPFKIVRLRSGQYRVERLVERDRVQTYQSATFSTERQARDWIERQDRITGARAPEYAVRPGDGGTHYVVVMRSGQGAPQMLGEFATEDDANTFVRRMRELDAGPTHGVDPEGRE